LIRNAVCIRDNLAIAIKFYKISVFHAVSAGRIGDAMRTGVLLIVFTRGEIGLSNQTAIPNSRIIGGLASNGE
jgi:hypothetical protein